VQPRWALPEPAHSGADGIDALAAALHLPEPICRLLVARGYPTSDVAKRFLRPRLELLHDPLLMAGLERAVERIVAAIRAGETILVHGDYDVDGICSTTLLTRALRGMGATVVPFIPRRLEDGYDLTMAGVEAAKRAGARVVITCDCGTSAREPVRALCESGIDVIVSDHHLPGGPLPECLAVLNPRQPGCDYPDKDLAAVGVAFKLALGVARALGASENPIFGMLDLVALATVADIAPLRGENRVLVRYGLKLMAESRNVGLRALIRAAGLEGRPLTAGRIGYVLAPRLNAVGRLGNALRGVELLTTEDESAANYIARELEELNRKRQDIDRMTLARARELVASIDLDETWGLVLAQEGWHPGVIGIVASRLVEEFGRPTLLIAIHDGVGKGSGRSIPAFDLHAGLGECSDLLLRYGGHRAAAGITIARDRIPDLAERFNAVARSRLVEDDLTPVVRIDLEVPLGAASAEMETLLRHFEPFGVGNPSPVLMVRGVRLQGAPRVVGRGQEGLRLRLADGSVSLDALGWGMAALAPSLAPGMQLDVAFRLERDEWNGQSRLQAKLAAVRW
jgi:single-stranded-DNA-specific exonuclease